MSKDTLKKELADIDARIELLKENIETGKSLEALHENPDFIRVIMNGYFDKEEKRIAGLLFNPTSLKRDQLENVMDKASAIRNYKQYFATVLIDANMAPSQIEEEELYRKEVTSRPQDDTEE